MKIIFVEIASASNSVWNEISSDLNNCISSGALYTIIHKGRYGIKEKLGISNILSTESATISTNFETDVSHQIRKSNKIT